MTEEELTKAKSQAYWERNQLVAALSKMYPSHLAKHPESDEKWEDDWRTIVVIYIPFDDRGRREGLAPDNMTLDGIAYYQLTWHIHDQDVSIFDHLTYQPISSDYARGSVGEQQFNWDGHTTEEKYRRLRTLQDGAFPLFVDSVRKMLSEKFVAGKEVGEKMVQQIADRELEPANRLEDYEREEVIDKDFSSKRGYPKGNASRKVVGEIINIVLAYHKGKIRNTRPEENKRDGFDMASDDRDPRIRRI